MRDNTISPPLLTRLPLPPSITTFRREVVTYALESPGPVTGLGKKGTNTPMLLGKIKYAKHKYSPRRLNTMSSGSMKRAYDKIFNDDGDTSGIFVETPAAATLTLLSHDETPMEPIEIIAPPTPAALVVHDPPVRKGVLPLSKEDTKWSLTMNISTRDMVDTKLAPATELSSEQAIKWVNAILSKELLDGSIEELNLCINKKK